MSKIDIASGRYWGEPLGLVDGCTHVSPGCDHCWSAKAAHMRQHNPNPKIQARYAGLTDKRGRFNGRVCFNPERLKEPLRARRPRVYAIWNDLFHVNVEYSDTVNTLKMMALSAEQGKGHQFLILTKRPREMAVIATSFPRLFERVRDVAWWGTTVENQEMANERIPLLLRIPGRRWLSIEPLLGPIELDFSSDCRVDATGEKAPCEGLRECAPDCSRYYMPIHQVVLGGETGPGARPMHPDWVRTIRNDCAAAGVPFFFKSWGSRSERRFHCSMSPETSCTGNCDSYCPSYKYGHKKLKGNTARLLDGAEHNTLAWHKEEA